MVWISPKAVSAALPAERPERVRPSLSHGNHQLSASLLPKIPRDQVQHGPLGLVMTGDHEAHSAEDPGASRELAEDLTHQGRRDAERGVHDGQTQNNNNCNKPPPSTLLAIRVVFHKLSFNIL